MSTPLEDYALIGDGETAALVSREGSIDWLCWPRFDSDACFAGLLGGTENGRWLIGNCGPGGSSVRRYQPDTLIVETDLVTDAGSARLIDFMPIRRDETALIRIVVGLLGNCTLRMDLRLRFAYGMIPPWIEAADRGFVATIGPDRVMLDSPVPLRLRDHAAEAEFTVAPGQRLAFVLRHHDSGRAAPPPLDAEALLLRTQEYWRDWIGRFDDRKTRWPEVVRRSLITLKAMIHRPTGGLVAAPTTSLPEVPGGTRNWDYRYCWLRDSTFTLGALINAGYHDEAERWRDWLLRAIGGSAPDMRIMYRVDGGRHLNETSIAGLPGYQYASPVRVGNSASGQLQIDVWGEVLDTLHLADHAGLSRSKQGDLVRRRLVEHLAAIWNRPDAGLWESRDQPRHYTYSRVMAWVGIDRFLRAHCVGEQDQTRGLAALRDQIRREICRDGWNDGLGAFTQYYGGQQLDASLLLMPLVGFLPANDPRMASTIAAVGRDLTEGGLVRRTARTAAANPEGTFLACSMLDGGLFELQGKTAEATAQFERMIAVRNDLGLLSEQYNVPGGHLSGNFPQTLTHLAVVNTGLSLSGPVMHRGGG